MGVLPYLRTDCITPASSRENYASTRYRRYIKFVGETSPFHLSTLKKAKQKSKLVQSDFVSYQLSLSRCTLRLRGGNMRARILSLALGFVLCDCVISAEPVGPHPYEVDEAYEVYNELIPLTETYVFSKGILVVQQQASQQPDVSSACLTQEGTDKFAETISNLSQVQRATWLLQPKFQTAKPVRFVSAETIQSLLGEGEGKWGQLL